MAQPHNNSDLIGCEVGGCLVETYLARGGLGEVFLARHHGGGRRVIKVLRHQYCREESARARFVREARSLARIVHPNVVMVYDFGVLEDGRQWLSMEYVEGPTVHEAVHKRGPLPLAEAYALLAHVAEALNAVHEQAIFHRDVKPGNLILVGGSVERVKLLDFGLAKASVGDLRATLTATGDVPGTPAFLAPEQILDHKDSGTAIDIYALGAVAYYILSGEPPFYDMAVRDVILAHLEKHPEPVMARRSEVSKKVSNFISRCLAKTPENRPTADEAAEFFSKAAAAAARAISNALLDQTTSHYATAIERFLVATQLTPADEARRNQCIAIVRELAGHVDSPESFRREGDELSRLYQESEDLGIELATMSVGQGDSAALVRRLAEVNAEAEQRMIELAANVFRMQPQPSQQKLWRTLHEIVGEAP